MTALITADVHLTDKPIDEYKWGLFPWILEQIGKHKVDELLVLGDLTDGKDKHPARLVNRLIDSISRITDHCYIIFLKGNHDYTDPKVPFFGFLEAIPHVGYVKQPEVRELSIGKATFIPAGERWGSFRLHELPYCFTHVTFDRSESENGSLLPGVDPRIVADYSGMIYSGDIHVPQRIGKNIEYIGAPYHIRYGDKFDPRVLLIKNDGKTKDLEYPAPRKWVINIHSVKDLNEWTGKVWKKDHVKVRCYLRRAELDKWREIKVGIKEFASKKNWVLGPMELLSVKQDTKKDSNKTESKVHVSDRELMLDYAKRHKVSPAYIKAGEAILFDQFLEEGII
jgi:Calcineurin-like phosphoesterase